MTFNIDPAGSRGDPCDKPNKGPQTSHPGGRRKKLTAEEARAGMDEIDNRLGAIAPTIEMVILSIADRVVRPLGKIKSYLRRLESRHDEPIERWKTHYCTCVGRLLEDWQQWACEACEHASRQLSRFHARLVLRDEGELPDEPPTSPPGVYPIAAYSPPPSPPAPGPAGRPAIAATPSGPRARLLPPEDYELRY